jgi:hypothetical protein
MKTVQISAIEYEGLCNLEKMVRIAMQSPDAAEGVVTALQALNAIRREEAGDAAAPVISGASTLANALIERSMRKEIE